MGSSGQCLAGDFIGIGKTGLFAADRAYADTLLDGVTALLDDTVLHRPALAPRMLKVQIAKIHARTEQQRKRTLQIRHGTAPRREQDRLGRGDAMIHSCTPRYPIT